MQKGKGKHTYRLVCKLTAACSDPPDGKLANLRHTSAGGCQTSCQNKLIDPSRLFLDQIPNDGFVEGSAKTI